MGKISPGRTRWPLRGQKASSTRKIKPQTSNRIIEMEKAMEQEGVKCFVVMANRTDLAKFRGARVQAIRDETRAMDGGPRRAS